MLTPWGVAFGLIFVIVTIVWGDNSTAAIEGKSLIDRITPATPLATSVRGNVLTTTTATPLVDTANHETPLVGTATHVTPLVDTTTHVTPLDDKATHEPPLVYTTTHETPLDDTTTHETPLDDKATHETPLDDTTTHETPLVDRATHETPLVDTVTLETPLVDTLKNLIAKQIVLCGYDSLCTIQNPTKPFAHVACCGTCSCNSDCLANHNCCVDYVLKRKYGNVTFNSIDDIHIALTNVTTKLEIETLLIYMYMRKDSTPRTNQQDNPTDGNDINECLTLQQDRYAAGKYFELVTGCAKGNLHSDNNCLKGDMEPAQVFDKFPVTSVMNGKTYKNKTLFDCCGDTNEAFEYWDMYVECRTFYGEIDFIPSYVTHPLILLDAQYIPARCYVVFEPNGNIKHSGFVPKECMKVDIKTCAMKPTSENGTFLKNFCESEEQYVQVVNQATSTIYKNAACVLCSHDNHTKHTKCQGSGDVDGVMKLRVNLDNVLQYQSAIKEMSDGGFLNTRALSRFSMYSANCSFGSIYVPLLEECIRLYCPRSMYIVNGSCVPLYDHVTGATFRTAFNMTIISPITADLEKASFKQALKAFLKEEHFSTASLTIERVRIINQGFAYMVEMTMSPINESDVTLSSVVEAVTSWYFTTFVLHISSTTVVEIGISPGSLSYFKTKSYHKIDDVETIRDLTKPSNVSRVFAYTIQISESYTCYRIALSRTSFIGLSRYAISIPMINETVYRENMDRSTLSNELLTCADLFLNQSLYFHVNFKFRMNTDAVNRQLFNQTTPVADDEKPMHLLLIVIIGAAGVVMCVVSRLMAEKVSVCLTHLRRNSAH